MLGVDRLDYTKGIDQRLRALHEILATGLHTYLTQFLDRVNDLGVGISRDFLVPIPG